MATLKAKSGSIVAHCPGCDGARSTFERRSAEQGLFGVITDTYQHQLGCLIDYRLFRCAGCGRGALGVVKYGNSKNPGITNQLLDFYPETRYRLRLPDSVPEGIKKEFEEAEESFSNKCFRAAAGLFRSVLDKTMRANGYNTRKDPNLHKQIEAAAEDGVITQARKKRAHDEVRVLGNDVLHEDWCEISDEDVGVSRHYTQRILEDFYDDRETVLSLLRAANRTPLEDQQQEEDSYP